MYFHVLHYFCLFTIGEQMWTGQIGELMVIQPTSKGLFRDDFSLPSHRLTLKLGWVGSLGPSRPVLENNGVIFIWLSSSSDCGVMCLLFMSLSWCSTILHFLVLCQNLCVLSLKAIFVLFVFFSHAFLKGGCLHGDCQDVGWVLQNCEEVRGFCTTGQLLC